ncbi:MAG: VWA domain-containing protein [Desulfobacterales bacterium]|nr:VWA domain-containing protein [Desulfobacterales bacterium]
MKKSFQKSMVLIGCLMLATWAVFAYANKRLSNHVTQVQTTTANSGILHFTGNLMQDKVYKNGNGRVSIALTLQADTMPNQEMKTDVDIVIVLDRSGSMEGNKLQDAKKSVVSILNSLTSNDRFALVTYSDAETIHCPLESVTDTFRNHLNAAVEQIIAAGGTHLSAGLQAGIQLFAQSTYKNKQRKLILISDGLANRGIIDMNSLCAITKNAAQETCSITTLGVGLDFNETLMTAMAVNGRGHYYFLENPSAFSKVFQQELHESRTVAASSLCIKIPLNNNFKLIDASGYPIEQKNNYAVFYPEELLSGQTRQFFLTFQLPIQTITEFRLDGISVDYKHDEKPNQLTLSNSFIVKCVEDPNVAMSSINTSIWEQKVIQEEYNDLKEQVAADIRSGNSKTAHDKINEYEAKQQAINSVVNSKEVTENLSRDVETLRNRVSATFQGNKADVIEKQKKHSKELQFEGYQGKKQR